MKHNPLYSFLSEHRDPRIVSKSGYYMIALSNPRVKPMLQLDGGSHALLDHHISAYEKYEDGTNYNSLYHYTAKFGNYIVHIYFDDKDNHSEPYFKEDTDAYKAISELVPESEKAMLNGLVMEFSGPMIHHIRTLHTSAKEARQKEYNTSLDALYERLYDRSEDLNGNLEHISALLLLGESIKRLSFQQQITPSMAYLERQKNSILKALEIQAEAKTYDHVPPQVPLVRELSHDEQMQALDLAALRATELASQREEAQRVIDLFEGQFTEFQATLQRFDHLLFSDFLGKVRELSKLQSLYGDLLFSSEAVASMDSGLMANPNVKHKAGLGVDAMYSKMQTRGVTLLDVCLSSDKLIQAYGSSLTRFADQVHLNNVDAALRKGQVQVLLYLLKYRDVAMNSYQVTFASSKSPLPMIFAAYELNQFDCFEALLKQNANPLVVYDGLPLAHTILSLPLVNPFRVSFIHHCPMYIQNPKALFSVITALVRIKLTDSDLSLEHKESLEQQMAFYELGKQSKAGQLGSKRVTRYSLEIAKNFNQEMYEKFRTSPEFLRRLKSITKSQDELAALLKKEHSESTFKSQSSRAMGHMHSMLSNEGLRQALNAMTKEDLLESLDKEIEVIDAYIYVWTNQGKAPQKKRDKQLKIELEKITQYNNRMNPPALETEQRLRLQAIEERMRQIRESLLDSISELTSAFDMIIASSGDYATEDEYLDIDFLGAANNDSAPTSSAVGVLGDSESLDESSGSSMKM